MSCTPLPPPFPQINIMKRFVLRLISEKKKKKRGLLPKGGQPRTTAWFCRTHPCLCTLLTPTAHPSPWGCVSFPWEVCGGRNRASPCTRWAFSSTEKPQASLGQIPCPAPPPHWDRPQPAGLPALINTGQAAKAAAGFILPGGPSSARVTVGRG